MDPAASASAASLPRYTKSRDKGQQYASHFVTSAVLCATGLRLMRGSPRWLYVAYGGAYFAFQTCGQLVPDQLKSAVSKADRSEPEINATYAEMAQHYGTAIVPARHP